MSRVRALVRANLQVLLRNPLQGLAVALGGFALPGMALPAVSAPTAWAWTCALAFTVGNSVHQVMPLDGLPGLPVTPRERTAARAATLALANVPAAILGTFFNTVLLGPRHAALAFSAGAALYTVGAAIGLRWELPRPRFAETARTPPVPWQEALDGIRPSYPIPWLMFALAILVLISVGMQLDLKMATGALAFSLLPLVIWRQVTPRTSSSDETSGMKVLLRLPLSRRAVFRRLFLRLYLPLAATLVLVLAVACVWPGVPSVRLLFLHGFPFSLLAALLFVAPVSELSVLWDERASQILWGYIGFGSSLLFAFVAPENGWPVALLLLGAAIALLVHIDRSIR